MLSHSTRRATLGIVATLALLAAGASSGRAAGTAVTRRVPAVPLSVATSTPAPSRLLEKVVPASLFPPPAGLHAVTGEGDCYGHFAGQYAFQGRTECRALISGGNLVLIWDAPPGTSADGYRAYRAGASGTPGSLLASVHDREQTLAQLPLGGFGCYVVTASYGAHESQPTRPFCPGAASTTVTRTLGTAYARDAFEDRVHTGFVADFKNGDPVPNGPVVGYFYASTKHTLGDTSYDKIRRYAVAFDVSPFANKRLVSAFLRLTIEQSYGQGNNHSCATTVGSGTEFWWKPDAATWIDGDFASGPRVGDTGPVVSADVTSLVAPILAGRPNYGFVIRNDDENLGAFTNAQCETAFGNPQLQLVYYDR